MRRLYGAIKKYLFKDTAYFFIYSYRYFQDNYKNNCLFYSDEEFADQIKNGKSVIRMGDGEIDLLHFLKIHYQKYSNSIRDDFLKIVRDYKNTPTFVLSIPLFVNYTNTQLKKSDRPNTFRCWLPLKITYEMLFNKKIKYYDAHIFYRNGKFEKIILPYIVSKKVIIVTNENNIKDMQQSKFSKYVFDYIECPYENAYEYRGTIQDKIKKIISDANQSKKDFITLMSAGLSKTIIYDMSKNGYQIIDIGKGIEALSKKTNLEDSI